MGIRGEVFSTKVLLKNRTYFFNVKENRLGDLYLNIVESKDRDEGGFERQSVIVFADDLQEFLQGFDESLKVLEKSVREKRRGTASGKERPSFRDKRPVEDSGEFSKPRRGFKDRKFDGDEKPRRSSVRRPRYEDGDDSGRQSRDSDRQSHRFNDGPPSRGGSRGSRFSGGRGRKEGGGRDFSSGKGFSDGKKFFDGKSKRDSGDRGKFSGERKKMVVRKK